MVVATFRDGTDMAEVFAVVAEERARVAELQRDGSLGAVHLAPERGTVFIETTSPDADTAAGTVRSLPMARWWDIDVFTLSAPANPATAGWSVPGGEA